MKYQKRERAQTRFFAKSFMRYTLHMGAASPYLALGTKRPTTMYCCWPVGRGWRLALPILWGGSAAATETMPRTRAHENKMATRRGF
jgi:hypothetical protein